MRAAVFTGPNAPLSIQEIDKPEIADDELLVRVSHCGICGTDIHASRAVYWTYRNTQIDRPRVTLMLLVGASEPGTMPFRFMIQM